MAATSPWTHQPANRLLSLYSACYQSQHWMCNPSDDWPHLKKGIFKEHRLHDAISSCYHIGAWHLHLTGESSAMMVGAGLSDRSCTNSSQYFLDHMGCLLGGKDYLNERQYILHILLYRAACSTPVKQSLPGTLWLWLVLQPSKKQSLDTSDHSYRKSLSLEEKAKSINLANPQVSGEVTEALGLGCSD